MISSSDTSTCLKDEVKELRQLFGYPYALPRSSRYITKSSNSYAPDSTTLLCESVLAASFLAPEKRSVQSLCAKMSPVLEAPVQCRLPPRDWFSDEQFIGAGNGELLYTVLRVFAEVARNDLLLAGLYRKLAQVSVTMGHYFRKMAERNRCYQRALLHKTTTVPKDKTQHYLKKLETLENLELQLLNRERSLVQRETQLAEEERSLWRGAHELPDQPDILVRSQQARRFAELERQAAWVERSYSIHQRLSQRNDYNFTKNEYNLVIRTLKLEHRYRALLRREERAKHPFLTKCSDIFMSYYNKITFSSWIRKASR